MTTATLSSTPAMTRSQKTQTLERFLITGAGGQLGAELHRQLAPLEKALPKPHDAFDVTQLKGIYHWLPILKPDVVINTAAYTNVLRAELDRGTCWKVNVEAVDALAKVCATNDIPLLHISTDYVFGHQRSRRKPYLENDPVGPLGYYAQTKALGEHAIFRQAAKTPEFRYWIVRTSALYERPWRDRSNFPTKLLSILSSRRDRDVGVADDIYTTPTYAPHLAEAILWMLENRDYIPSGIYHITNRGACSWFEFADKLARGAKLFATNLKPTTREAYYKSIGQNPDIAPTYTVLAGIKYSDVLAAPLMPDWQEGVAEWCREHRRKSSIDAG